jgi:hypothetical protein
VTPESLPWQAYGYNPAGRCDLGQSRKKWRNNSLSLGIGLSIICAVVENEEICFEIFVITVLMYNSNAKTPVKIQANRQMII